MGSYRGYKFWKNIFDDYNNGSKKNIRKFCKEHDISHTVFYKRLKEYLVDKESAYGRKSQTSQVKYKISDIYSDLLKNKRQASEIKIPSVRNVVKELNGQEIPCKKSIVHRYMMKKNKALKKRGYLII